MALSASDVNIAPTSRYEHQVKGDNCGLRFTADQSDTEMPIALSTGRIETNRKQARRFPCDD
jgi:hypothetical protein